MASIISEKDIYGGKYHLIHNPNARGRAPRYKVLDIASGEEIRPKGVTTILGQTLSKDLMQWAVDSCINYLREKLPVVTEKDLEVGANEYIRLREAGGTAGSEAHELVEHFLLNTKATGKYGPEARAAYDAFVNWFNNVKPEVLDVERSIFSENFQYSGTFDGLIKINGKIYLSDLKTTNPSRKAPNGVYAENFIQLGAYALAYEEERQAEIERLGKTDMVEIDDLMIISAKKNGVLDIVTAQDIELGVDDCKEMAKRVINIHAFMNYTTKQLGGK